MDDKEVDEWNKMNRGWLIRCLIGMTLSLYIGYSIGIGVTV